MQLTKAHPGQLCAGIFLAKLARTNYLH